MPLPEYPPFRVHAPRWAGIGLRFPARIAQRCWPADWWQRDCDDELVDESVPFCMTERMRRIPDPPEAKR